MKASAIARATSAPGVVAAARAIAVPSSKARGARCFHVRGAYSVCALAMAPKTTPNTLHCATTYAFTSAPSRTKVGEKQ